MRAWAAWQNREEGAIHSQYKQEVHAVWVYSCVENEFCFDLDLSEVDTLFVFLYNIPYFKDGPIEVHFPESDAEWEVS